MSFHLIIASFFFFLLPPWLWNWSWPVPWPCSCSCFGLLCLRRLSCSYLKKKKKKLTMPHWQKCFDFSFLIIFIKMFLHHCIILLFFLKIRFLVLKLLGYILWNNRFLTEILSEIYKRSWENCDIPAPGISNFFSEILGFGLFLKSWQKIIWEIFGIIRNSWISRIPGKSFVWKWNIPNFEIFREGINFDFFSRLSEVPGIFVPLPPCSQSRRPPFRRYETRFHLP